MPPACHVLSPCALAVFSSLAAAGISVHSYDAHGHGQSEPRGKKDRAFVRKFSDLVSVTCSYEAMQQPALMQLLQYHPSALGD